ncbi:MAG TPA: DUF2939 domain-containing protein [Bradyrhizobium sp.]|jgi:hypothetical protein|nr:DUF2939 domain-containing protein [Bradyrhizobium sp.]
MRWFVGALVALLVLIGVYAGSAVMSLNGLVEAARAGDGAQILARTDQPRLRHSLVDQIVTAYLIQTGQNRPIKPWERMVANTYGASIADAMVSKMLTPENLANILSKGTLAIGPGMEASMLPLGELDTSKLLGILWRFSPVKPVEFSVRLGDSDSSGAISLHFEGDAWRLSGVQLPAPALKALAQSLPDNRGRKG